MTEVLKPSNGSGTVAAAFQAPMAIPQQTEGMAMVNMIERASRDPSVDIDKFERLLAMKERIVMQDAEAAFNEALTLAQQEMRPVVVNAENKQTRSMYADYEALDRAVRPIYTRHGFSMSYNTEDGAPPDHTRVVCYVAKGRYTRKYQADMPSDGKGARGGDVMTKTHAVGASMSYGQRYLLKMIFNLAVSKDMDGNDASGVITDAQAATIRDGLTETQANVDMFLEYIGAESISDIPAAAYNKAIRAIETKRKQKS